MIKCEVIKDFTLGRFDELQNIQRKRIDTQGKLYVGDTFECSEELAKYLTGNNAGGNIVVKIIEVKPEIKILSQSPVEELEKSLNVESKITNVNYNKPKKKKTSKK